MSSLPIFPASASLPYRTTTCKFADQLDCPPPVLTLSECSLTFASLTDITAAFLSALGISKFAVYLFDIGAPVALRLAIERRFTITSMITQNGNAYEEGLGAFFDPIKRYWKSGSAADREFMLKNALTLPSMKAHYIDGVPEGQLQRMAPETWTLGYAQMMDRPGGTEIMLDVFYDYRTNVDLYPKFQAWLRETQVPLLAIWGKNDPSFIPPGAKAFKNDVKDAEIVFLDTGHYVLETHLNEAAEKILDFLGKQKTLRE